MRTVLVIGLAFHSLVAAIYLARAVRRRNFVSLVFLATSFGWIPFFANSWLARHPYLFEWVVWTGLSIGCLHFVVLTDIESQRR